MRYHSVRCPGGGCPFRCHSTGAQASGFLVKHQKCWYVQRGGKCFANLRLSDKDYHQPDDPIGEAENLRFRPLKRCGIFVGFRWHGRWSGHDAAPIFRALRISNQCCPHSASFRARLIEGTVSRNRLAMCARESCAVALQRSFAVPSEQSKRKLGAFSARRGLLSGEFDAFDYGGAFSMLKIQEGSDPASARCKSSCAPPRLSNSGPREGRRKPARFTEVAGMARFRAGIGRQVWLVIVRMSSRPPGEKTLRM